MSRRLHHPRGWKLELVPSLHQRWFSHLLRVMAAVQMPQKQEGRVDGFFRVRLRLWGLRWDGVAWPGLVRGYLVVAAVGVLLGV